MKSQVSSYDSMDVKKMPLDEALFQLGDIYITCHSNLPSVQVNFATNWRRNYDLGGFPFGGG